MPGKYWVISAMQTVWWAAKVTAWMSCASSKAGSQPPRVAVMPVRSTISTEHTSSQRTRLRAGSQRA